MKRLAKLRRRGWLLLPAAFALLLLAWWFGRPPAAPPAPPDNPVAVAAPRDPTPPAVAAPPAEAVVPVPDIFAVQTWALPPAPVDTTPPPPQAPPLPFKFLGRIVEPGQPVAFMLANGARLLVVSVGDAIGHDYRVEKYQNGQLYFRYRPMNLQQALAVGNNT